MRARPNNIRSRSKQKKPLFTGGFFLLYTGIRKLKYGELLDFYFAFLRDAANFHYQVVVDFFIAFEYSGQFFPGSAENERGFPQIILEPVRTKIF